MFESAEFVAWSLWILHYKPDDLKPFSHNATGLDEGETQPFSTVRKMQTIFMKNLNSAFETRAQKKIFPLTPLI